MTSFRQNGYGVAEQLLPLELVEALLRYAKEQRSNQKFTPANVGKGEFKTRDAAIRSDEIFWIDDWTHPTLLMFDELLSALQVELKKCFLPIKRYECHLAHYHPNGHYQRHRDRHKNTKHRLVSCVFYLSPWKAGQGGELQLYLEDEYMVQVQPIPGRLVLFDSELEHEVKTTEIDRWSLTSWFRDDLVAGLFL